MFDLQSNNIHFVGFGFMKCNEIPTTEVASEKLLKLGHGIGLEFRGLQHNIYTYINIYIYIYIYAYICIQMNVCVCIHVNIYIMYI